MEDKNYNAKLLFGITFLLSVIVYGTIIFVKAEQIDSYTCIYFLKRILPYCLIVGWLGYLIGKIIDASNRKKTRKKRKKK